MRTKQGYEEGEVNKDKRVKGEVGVFAGKPRKGGEYTMGEAEGKSL